MSAQTNYARNQNDAYAGQVYGLFPKEIISRSVETAAGVAFGVVVSRGTDKDTQCIIGGTTGVLGITLRSLDREGDDTGAVSYAAKDSAAIMRNGYVHVVCPTGCVPSDAVNYVETTGVLDSGAAVDATETTLDDCFWDSTTAAGGIGILRVKNVENITAGS